MKKWTVLLLCFAVVICVYCLTGLCTDKMVSVFSENKQMPADKTIIIDAGHGGEDGGAISCTGVPESTINLEIALRLKDLIAFMGYDTDMTRTDESAIHTEGHTIAQRKVSDLKNRVEYVNRSKNPVLISIHQNYFADNHYSGAQVFFAETEGSSQLAELIQDNIKETLNPGSKRMAKTARNIYLMDRIQCVGVLVECGFLSNYREEALLRDADHQKKLCAVIASSVSIYLQAHEVLT